MKYPVIFEPTPTGFSAYVPDLDGCVSVGSTLEEARTMIGEAIALHITGMCEDGTPVPEPSLVELVDVEFHP